MGTTSRGYPTPEGSDNVDIPGDLSALASAINTDVGSVDTAKAAKATTITAGTGLTGGGDLSANRTLSVATGGVTDAMLAGSIAPSKVTGTAVVQARQVATGTGLTGGGDLSADRTLSIAAGGVGTTQLADGAATFAKTSGVAVARAYRNGSYIVGNCGAVTTLTPYVDGRLFGVPLYLPVATNIDRIGVYISLAGSAGSVVRLGVYLESTAAAASLVFDAGTVNGTVTGFQEITVTQTLPAGLVYLCAASQGAAATHPTFTATSGITPFGRLSDTGNQSVYNNSITGALPATLGLASYLTTAPIIGVRKAA